MEELGKLIQRARENVKRSASIRNTRDGLYKGAFYDGEYSAFFEVLGILRRLQEEEKRQNPVK